MVAVHGVGQQLRGESRLLAEWWPAITDGLCRAGREGAVSRSDTVMAFYGDVFRPPGQLLATGDPPWTAADVEEGFERELLAEWWRAAAGSDPAVVPPDAQETLAATPRSVQAALRALSGSRFFAGVALRAMVSDLKQVRRYLTDPQVRDAARGRVLDALGEDTRVVVAHSLGSVVAYEALCARPGHRVQALVTFGSPLGIPHLVFDRLEPSPVRMGGAARGVWPGGEQLTWTNIADEGDVVALVKDLRPCFGDGLRSVRVHNGARAHDASAYLTDALCGNAIAQALS
ncbi:hypothetical protein F8144_25775 [Streptomyces triticiradicis]|uniref:Alpha/beta hydrolase n=1 Tax=Streptomyces triticiradicis TaxID=2651189 RepID=A0A7J5DAM1_9ACTN|nr:hypothetical protein F8144_25775 [Streptomyces triticiradicis]